MRARSIQTQNVPPQGHENKQQKSRGPTDGFGWGVTFRVFDPPIFRFANHDHGRRGERARLTVWPRYVLPLLLPRAESSVQLSSPVLQKFERRCTRRVPPSSANLHLSGICYTHVPAAAEPEQLSWADGVDPYISLLCSAVQRTFWASYVIPHNAIFNSLSPTRVFFLNCRAPGHG